MAANLASTVALDILSATQDADNKATRIQIGRSFLSDTITAPTKEMMDYAALASLGDDVYYDPCTATLEKHIASITGKEAGLFVSSGTMSNQICVRSHLMQPPHSVICDVRSHVFKYEAGGFAYHSQAQAIPLFPVNGKYLTSEEIEAHLLLGDDVHFAKTRVIALENTLNGLIFPQDEIKRISDLAKSHDIKLHLDGARIWHVAAETGTPIHELCEPFDSVSVCFSKGLGAPIGSCLVGTADLIAKAKAFRKLFGGGMRQTGFLAAAAAFALTNHFPLLTGVHQLAKRLQVGLENLGATILVGADTCMVFYDPAPLGLDYETIRSRAAALDPPIQLAGSRLVVHIQTSEKAVDDFLQLVKDMAAEKRVSGYIPDVNATSKGVTANNVYVRAGKAKAQ